MKIKHTFLGLLCCSFTWCRGMDGEMNGWTPHASFIKQMNRCNVPKSRKHPGWVCGEADQSAQSIQPTQSTHEQSSEYPSMLSEPQYPDFYDSQNYAHWATKYSECAMQYSGRMGEEVHKNAIEPTNKKYHPYPLIQISRVLIEQFTPEFLEVTDEKNVEKTIEGKDEEFIYSLCYALANLKTKQDNLHIVHSVINKIEFKDPILFVFTLGVIKEENQKVLIFSSTAQIMKYARMFFSQGEDFDKFRDEFRKFEKFILKTRGIQKPLHTLERIYRSKHRPDKAQREQLKQMSQSVSLTAPCEELNEKIDDLFCTLSNALKEDLVTWEDCLSAINSFLAKEIENNKNLFYYILNVQIKDRYQFNKSMNEILENKLKFFPQEYKLLGSELKIPDSITQQRDSLHKLARAQAKTSSKRFSFENEGLKQNNQLDALEKLFLI